MWCWWRAGQRKGRTGKASSSAGRESTYDFGVCSVPYFVFACIERNRDCPIDPVNREMIGACRYISPVLSTGIPAIEGSLSHVFVRSGALSEKPDDDGG